MNSKSPFSKTRFEHDGRHLYFIKDDVLKTLEGDSPILITGSRGTGKTTLLNALNWKEQKDNPHLKNALIANDHRNDYLGIYIKLPELKIKSFKQWEGDNFDLYTLIFSFYLELVWIQELLNAIISLRFDDTLSYSASEEKNCVSNLVHDYSRLFSSFTSHKNISTLFDVADCIKTIRKYIEDAGLFKVSINEVYKNINDIDQIGSTGIGFTKHLGRILSKNDCEEPLKIKVCMDECECLDESQLLVTNTLIRLSKFPVFYAFSFISEPANSSETLIANITNQKADLQRIRLDDMTNDDFSEFANGVAEVRVSAATETDNIKFDANRIFGEFSINGLLVKLLNKSESPFSKALLKSAKNNKSHGFYELYKSETLPIYQTYLVEMLGIDTKDNINETWKRRRQESKEIRKRMVSAYLSICKEINMEPYYSSAAMILMISDKSIRDYLWQLDEIYNCYNKTINEFVSSTIDVETQNKGIRLSSTGKLNSLPNSPVTNPDKVGKLVYGLATLTEVIQTQSNDMSHLRSSERGIFNLKFGETDTEIIKFIKDASDAGFIRIIGNEPNTLRFRVHASLSPSFNFSYRGAYYDTNISILQLLKITSSNNKDELKNAVKNIAQSIYDIGDSPTQIMIDGL